MKIRLFIPAASMLFLMIGIILAIAGITQRSWLYLLFSLTHLMAGVMVWLIYKYLEEKIEWQERKKNQGKD